MDDSHRGEASEWHWDKKCWSAVTQLGWAGEGGGGLAVLGAGAGERKGRRDLRGERGKPWEMGRAGVLSVSPQQQTRAKESQSRSMGR